MSMYGFRHWPALLAATLAAAGATTARAEDGVSTGPEGISFKSGDLELTLGGRVHLDALAYDDDVLSDETADFRRARIELGGEIGDILRFRIDREFARGGGWRNVWAAVRPADGVELRGGNFIVPFSMEELQSSNAMPLIERSLVTALAPGFSLGGGARVSQRNFTLAAGYFGDALSDEDERSERRGEGFAARATMLPVRNRSTFLHLAAAIERRDLDLGDSLRFTANPGTVFAPALVTTRAITDAERLTNIGGEAAFATGPLLLQGQYLRSQVDRLGGADTLNFDAWYAMARFIVTGRDYDYSRGQGIVSGVDLPRRGGAVELVARISQIDLNDGLFQRGRGQTLTGGVNWYINRNLRVMANYARSEVEDVALTADRDADLFVARFQIGF